MSDSSRGEVVFGEQTVNKDTPATAGEVLYRTGGGGDAPSTHEDSDQVRPDLKDTSDTMTGMSLTYGFDSHWVHRASRQPLRSVLKNNYVATVTVTGVGGDISFVTGTNKITSTLTDKFNTILVGRPIYIVGSLSANNGWALVLSRTTGATPEMVVDWKNLSNHTPAGAATVITQYEHITEGTLTNLYYTVEERYLDLTTNHIDTYVGMKGDSFNLTIPLPGKINYAWAGTGLTPDFGRATSVFSGVVDPVSTNPIQNGARNIADIREGGVLGPYEFGSMSCNIASGARARGKLGSMFNTRIGSNKFGIGGSFSLYNDDNIHALRLKRHNHTPTSLAWILRDDNGNEDLWWMPHVFLRTSPRNMGGNDAFVQGTFDYSSKMHPTYGFMVCVMSRTAV